MRTLMACGAAMALLIGALTEANAARFCAAYTTGGKNCGFISMQQCQMAVNGVGGFCGRSASSR